MDIWVLVLSSSLVSGVVSASVAGWFNLRSKRNEYANVYYRMILERRLAAYEEVERLIASIKVAVVDCDQKPYHLLFSRDDDQVGVYKTLGATMSDSLWLSDELFALTRELNVLVYSGMSGNAGVIEFGKRNYADIAELRTKMEAVHMRDMLTLHDVPTFLKAKKPAEGYTALTPRG